MKQKKERMKRTKTTTNKQEGRLRKGERRREEKEEEENVERGCGSRPAADPDHRGTKPWGIRERRNRKGIRMKEGGEEETAVQHTEKTEISQGGESPEEAATKHDGKRPGYVCRSARNGHGIMGIYLREAALVSHKILESERSRRRRDSEESFPVKGND